MNLSTIEEWTIADLQEEEGQPRVEEGERKATLLGGHANVLRDMYVSTGRDEAK